MSAIEEKYKDFTREELLSWIEHCEIFFDENLVQDNEFNARFSVYGRLVRYATKKNDELAALRGRVNTLRTIVYAHAFKAVLNGETGHTYLRCCACNGDNESKVRNNLNPDEVNHEHNCSVATVLQEAQ